MSCFDRLLRLFSQSCVLREARGDGSEQTQEVPCAAPCALANEQASSDNMDSLTLGPRAADQGKAWTGPNTRSCNNIRPVDALPVGAAALIGLSAGSEAFFARSRS